MINLTCVKIFVKSEFIELIASKSNAKTNPFQITLEDKIDILQNAL